jgi:hypothetical protein
VREGGTILGPLSRLDELTMTGAPPGRIFWYIVARSGADVRAELRVFAAGHRTRTRPVAWANGVEPPHLVVELEPGDEPAVLAGHVIDGRGALVEARVIPANLTTSPELAQPDSLLTVVATSMVAADGSFAIAGVPRGRFRLTVSRAGDPPAWIDAEAPSGGIEIRFPAKAALDVRYTDTAGRPVIGAWMHVCTTDRHSWWDLRTDSDGRARFEALPATEVDVLPAARSNWGGITVNQPIPGERRTLAAGTTARVELVLPERCRVTVVVHDELGHPTPQVEVHVAAERGLAFADRTERERLPRLDLTTDAEGRVSFDVLPCRGEVKALRQGRVNSAKFVAEIGSSPTVEIVLPSVTGVVRGRVLERGSGAPVAGRPVKVWWDGKVIAEAATGDDGRFVASGVPSGRVRVYVQGMTDANDWEGRRVDPKSPYGGAEIEFDMTAGEDRPLALTLPRIKGTSAERTATTIDAAVVDSAGAASKGAWVLVRGLIDGTWCSLGDGQSDDAGRARLAVVAAERYRITAGLGARRVEVERDAAAAISERLALPNE